MNKLEKNVKILMNKFKDNEIIKRYAKVIISDKDFYDYISSKIGVDRHYEVIFGIINDGKIIVARQDNYPEGIFRIPSGGGNINEDVESALFREVEEELGYSIIDYWLIGIIEYEIIYMDKCFSFFSFCFIITKFEESTNTNIDDELSEIKQVDYEFLSQICHSLTSIKDGFWNNWGMLRYHGNKLFYDYLKGE